MAGSSNISLILKVLLKREFLRSGPCIIEFINIVGGKTIRFKALPSIFSFFRSEFTNLINKNSTECGVSPACA